MKKRIGTRGVDRLMRVASSMKGSLAPTLASALWKDVMAKRPELAPENAEEALRRKREALDAAEERRLARAAKRVKR